MASYVPDFELDPSSPRGENRNAMGDEELMELLWQNGQVVTRTQNQRSLKKLTNGGGGGGGGFAEIPFLQPSSTTYAREISSSVVDGETGSRQRHQPQHQQLFIQEDEMASWLQYPLDDLDREIYSDILYSPPTSPPHRETRSGVTTEELLRPQIPPAPSTSSIAPRPPIGPQSQSQSRFSLAPSTSVAAARPPTICSTDVEEMAAAAAPPPPKFQNFLNFSRVSKGIKIESEPSSSMKTPRELTRVDSNETPTATAGQESRFTPTAAGSSAQLSGRNGGTSAASTSTAGKDFATTCDLTVTASPGGSAASVSASVEVTPPEHKPTLSTAEDERKRKEVEPDDNDCQSDDDDIGSGEVKKQSHKSTSVKRSRAAEVHNLSERRRRDRINEKMKALQELIPRCNKVDKASMLDEAIEYLKSLQLQVQMMSMGCGMVPMMYPGAQQHYMPAMGMGMGMGMMGMGMDIGAMNQPMMMPYPTQFPASGFPLQPAAAAAAAANLAPRFPMPPFPLQQVPVPMQGSNQHLTAFQQPQVPIHSYVQNQVVVQPSTNNPSNRRDAVNPP